MQKAPHARSAVPVKVNSRLLGNTRTNPTDTANYRQRNEHYDQRLEDTLPKEQRDTSFDRSIAR